LGQPILDDRAFDFARTGKRIAATNTTQAMVTRSSIRVKALIDRLHVVLMLIPYDVRRW
jgi:hypothetical protein